jgi:glucose-6-phosphate 1-dehydrogenase
MQPLFIVIFGGTGDLAQRKLVPALYRLKKEGQLPKDFTLVGFGRKDLTKEQFAALFLEADNESFAPHVQYLRGLYDTPDGFKHLALILNAQPSNALFYFSTPPETYADIVRQLQAAGLAAEPAGCWRRVVVEKPFGHDLASAKALNATLTSAFKEEQIFRIDHYLAKDTVRAIPSLLNGKELKGKMGAKDVDQVQITVAEDLGVENRGGYYDTSGALRDMVQSHILQVLALILMERPHEMTAENLRQAKLAVLQQLKIKRVVRAQYAAGTIAGKPVPGYAQELGVNPQSATETFVALKLESAGPRWSGVPFFIRVGKRLPLRAAAWDVLFKDGSGLSFPINPKKAHPVREAHEVLFPAVIDGDATLFPSWAEIEACWRVVDAVRAQFGPLQQYAAGTWGPKAAEELLEQRAWVSP